MTLFRSPIPFLIAAAIAAGCGRPGKSSGSVEFRQYYVKGQQLYSANCSNCHQTGGEGLGLLYPPLNESDFMRGSRARVICLIRNGWQGELVVNGKTYNQPMPAFSSLSEIELAQLTTYIYNTWSHEEGIVSITEVREALDSCGVVR